MPRPGPTTRHRPPLLLASILLLASCGGETSSGEPPDVGTPPDSGDHDGGPTAHDPDSGPAADPARIDGEDDLRDAATSSDGADGHDGDDGRDGADGPPQERGPYPVGYDELRMPDGTTEPGGRSTIGVWYPAAAAEGQRTRIASLIESGSYDEAPPATDGPFPLVMFSHGNQGASFQSFTYYEHLASHGFVVAAPDHAGNRIADNPDDSEVAAIALRRPDDIMRAMATVEDDPTFGPLTDGTGRGVSGHSFGGYTALVLAGARVDVDAAVARCEAGTESDIFCPYVSFWAPGEVVERPQGSEVFVAALAMAPGGYAAFGDDGVAAIDVPVFLMGGTDDEFTATDIEPIYDALDDFKLWLSVERGGHMMFTDICRLPLADAIPELAVLCDPATHIDTDRGFEIVNTYATAFFRYELKGELDMAPYLRDPPTVAFDEATLRVGQRR